MIVHQFLFSQVSIGEWGALTSTLNIRHVVFENKIYAATEGGLLEINDNEYRVLTTVNGLDGVDLFSITSDQNSHLWLGGASPFGFLQIFDPSDNSSIQSFNFGLTSINDIIILDSLAFVLYENGQDYGILKFMYNEKWEYRDNFKNFPYNMGSINCISSIHSSLIIGTGSGIFIGQLNYNLKDPNNWLPLNPEINFQITSLKTEDDTILFSSQTKLYNYVVNENNFSEIIFFNDLVSIKSVLNEKDSLWVLDNDKLYFKEGSKNDLMVYQGSNLSSIVSKGNKIVIGSSLGLIFVDKMPYNDIFRNQHFVPNSPSQSGFSAITILSDGRLVGGNSNGLSIYSDQGWRNILEIKKNNSSVIQSNYDFSTFIADTIPYDFGGYISDIEEGPDGLIYCAIRGSYPKSFNPERTSGGVIAIDIDNPNMVQVIDTTYLSYHSTSSNSNPYMLVLDIEFDKYDNLWIANPYCINGNEPIHVKSNEGIWKHYGSNETSTKISQSPVSIVFDNWDRVWFSAFQAEEANVGIYPNGGIFMLNYEGDAYNPSYFDWSKIQEQGTVWSLAIGKENRLYYLTPNGLNYFDLNENNNPIINENNFPYFPNVSFGQGAELKVDSHSNIWAHSPSQGVHILLENTTYWPDVNGLRTFNSPLLSDEITDIAFDPNKKIAYIATSKGINTLRIPFGINEKDLSNVILFPSPFFIPSEIPLKIDGLPYNCDMMVMTLDGKVIKKVVNQGISINGDQLLWDGRDENGHYVSSGVYLIALYSSNGKNIMEKITVINR